DRLGIVEGVDEQLAQQLGDVDVIEEAGEAAGAAARGGAAFAPGFGVGLGVGGIVEGTEVAAGGGAGGPGVAGGGGGSPGGGQGVAELEGGGAGVSRRATDENQDKNPGCGGLAARRPPPPGPSRSSRCAGEDTPQKLGAGELSASGALLRRLRVYSSISINPG